MSKPPNRNLEEVLAERFLAARLSGDPDEVGISSNAMIVEAILDEEVQTYDYPNDVFDLARCCVTFAKAPPWLKEAMLPRLADFARHVSELELYSDNGGSVAVKEDE